MDADLQPWITEDGRPGAPRGYSERSDDKGCWRCVSHSPPGHAFFCGCDCHGRPRWPDRRDRMRAAIGSREVGPFPGFHVGRDRYGVIWRCEAA